MTTSGQSVRSSDVFDLSRFSEGRIVIEYFPTAHSGFYFCETGNEVLNEHATLKKAV